MSVQKGSTLEVVWLIILTVQQKNFYITIAGTIFFNLDVKIKPN